MPSKITQNIVLRCSTKLAIVKVGRTKEPPSLFFHEQRFRKTSLEKEEATLVRLVPLNIHHNQIQVLSLVNCLPCIQPHFVLHFIMVVIQLLQYLHI